MRKYQRRFMMVVAVIIILITACASYPPVVEVPLEWPDFPAPPDSVVLENGMVSMPLDYWLAIAEYAVKVDTVRRIVGDSIQR